MGRKPNWPRGYIPTAKEWAAAFAQKEDENAPGIDASDLEALQAVEFLSGNEIVIVGVPNGDGTLTVRSVTGLVLAEYGASLSVSNAVIAEATAVATTVTQAALVGQFFLANS